MLARLARELPVGDVVYEPKWDGFRCLAFVCGGEVDLRSRNQRPLARYFPEVVAALADVADGTVLDGELLVTRDGEFVFDALLERIHPAASRVQLLAQRTPASFVAFDALSDRGADLTAMPFLQRRARLETVLPGDAAGLCLTPTADDVDTARRWLSDPPPGCDGVMVKPSTLTYQPGKRVMTKVKPERTCDCVIAGVRIGADGLVTSMMLGLYDADGRLHAPGVVTSAARKERLWLTTQLPSLVVPLREHPWRDGFNVEGGASGRLKGGSGKWTPDMTLDWLPLRPQLVVEVSYDRANHGRFRHPAKFRRWRPDRDGSTCSVDQLG
jgi:ATP-dependent DNA ligase